MKWALSVKGATMGACFCLWPGRVFARSKHPPTHLPTLPRMDLDAIEEDTFLNVLEPEPDQSAKAPATQLRPSLLTTVSELIASFDEKYPAVPPAPSTLHPLAPAPPDTEVIENILHAVGVIATTLASHVPSGDDRYEKRSEDYTRNADSWLYVSVLQTDGVIC